MLKIEKLKDLLGLSSGDMTQDAALRFVIDDVEEAVCNYCNTDSYPPGLVQTGYRMAIDLWNRELKSGDGTGQTGNLTSLKAGDVSWTWGDAGGNTAEYMQSILKRYDRTLQRYRQVRW